MEAVPSVAFCACILEGMQSRRVDAGILLRRLEHGDHRTVLEVFGGLSERSRRLRFLGPKPRLLADEIERLVDVGCCGREAVTAVEVATGRSVGIARFVRDEDGIEAEIAFAVVDEWQGRGIGRRLAAELRALARREGVERLRASVSADNRAGLALVLGLGRVVSARIEGAVHEVVVAVPP